VVKHYDIAIIGGGLVGASLACALAPLGLKLALLEAVPAKASSQPSYDDRTLALSASSCNILQGLGIWPDLQKSATPIREIQVREFQRPGRVIMAPAELGLDSFGHVVEARVFGNAVMQRVNHISTLDFLCPVAVSRVNTTETRARIEYILEGKTHEIEATLLVGADGADSFVRESLGIEVESYDYRQTAVICNITPELGHHGRAFECFTPTGPFAVMPHVEGRCGLIWCVSTSEVAEMMEMSDQEYLRRAQQRFGTHLGRFQKIGRRSCYPLRLVRALEDIRPGVVILGNAAHTIHPVGAQGFNLGLRDVAVLAELLWEQCEMGSRSDISSMTLLNRYSSLRKQDQDETVAYSDGLARFFSNTSPLGAAARTAGLLAHGFMPSLRRQLAIRAMGFRGHIPRLAMGEPISGSVL
jgi:2-octaprenyl-6-methoxyphenol hydroxylase